jgi:hypothetical protein
MTAGTPVGLSFEEVRRLHAASVHRLCLVALGHPVAAEATAGHVLSIASTAYLVDRPAPPVVLRWLLGVACEVIAEGAPPRRRWGRAPAALVTGWGEEVDVALAAAGRLPARQRMAAGLRCAAGLGYGEIAEILGIRAETARAACTRGTRRLRQGTGSRR